MENLNYDKELNANKKVIRKYLDIYYLMQESNHSKGTKRRAFENISLSILEHLDDSVDCIFLSDGVCAQREHIEEKDGMNILFLEDLQKFVEESED